VITEGNLDNIYFKHRNGITHTKYSYEDNLLISKTEERYDENTKMTANTAPDIYEYDDQNVLSGIRSGEHYLYIRNMAMDFSSLVLEAEKRTLLLLKEHIKQHKPKEKLFTIYLCYSEQQYFPPTISYGLASEREEWLTKEDGHFYIWNSAEYKHVYDYLIRSKEDEHFYSEYNQEIAMNDKNDVAIASIVNIAIALKESLAELGLNTTDDFVFLASNCYMSDLNENFKKINPEKFGEFEKDLP